MQYPCQKMKKCLARMQAGYRVRAAINGKPDELLKEIHPWGGAKVDFEATENPAFIRRLLKLPFRSGRIGVIYGEK
jgi:hypothetical protein